MTCGDAFDTVSKTVAAQWESAKGERSTMFEGVGLWSGGGATAASTALDKRIADLESLKGKLDASAKAFHDSCDAVTRAKNQITENVGLANQVIENIQNLSSDEASDDDKEKAIAKVIVVTRSENLEVVANEGAKVSGEPPTCPKARSVQTTNSYPASTRRSPGADAPVESPAASRRSRAKRR